MKIMKKTYCGVLSTVLLLCINAYADLTNGLSAYYKFDGNENDETGLHNGAARGSPVYIDGMCGQAALFDGIDDIIDAGVSRDLLNSPQVSFSYWINYSDLTHEHSFPLSVWDGGGAVNGDVVLFLSPYSSPSGTNLFSVGFATGVDAGFSSLFKVDYLNNQWLHVCLVLDNTLSNNVIKARLYINAEEMPAELQSNNGTMGSNIGDTSQILRLGGVLGWPNRFMAGKLDEFRIYKKALTATDVVGLYSAVLGKVAVIFDSQGGSVVPKNLYGTNDVYGTLPVTTRIGHNFEGWFTSAVDGTLITSNSMVGSISHIVYAKWTTIPYTVTLNANGGSGGTVSVSATYGAEMPAAIAPTRTGYTFDGYYDLQEGGVQYYTAGMGSARNWDVTGGATLYARWKEVQYADGLEAYYPFNGNANDVSSNQLHCTVSNAVLAADRNGNTNSAYDFNGTTAFLTTPVTLRGFTAFTFSGWFYARSNESAGKYPISFFQSVDQGRAALFVGGINNVVALWVGDVDGVAGQWLATSSNSVFTLNTWHHIVVTYDSVADIHTVYLNGLKVAESTVAIGPMPDTAPYYPNTIGVNYSPTVAHRRWWNGRIDDVRIYRKALAGADVMSIYTADLGQVAVIFDSQGGSLVPRNLYGTNGVAVYGTLPTTTRSGHTFGGWFTSAVDGTQIASNTLVGTTSHVVYAHWTANRYVVTFNAQEGSVSPGTAEVTYNSVYGTLPTPTRTGFTFGGWWTGTGGTGTQVTEATKVTITTAQTLYAKWTASTYTVTLNANGGSGGTVSVSATYGAAMPVATAPTRAGYTFAGYYDQPEGGTQYYTAGMGSARNWDVIGGATLYAQWISHGTVRFQKALYSVGEQTEVSAAVLKVERVGGSTGTATVSFTVEDGTATATVDYSSDPYTLTWTNGQMGARSIVIDVLDDESYEGNETLTVRLVDAVGVTLGEPDEAVVTIVDNEGASYSIARLTGDLNFGEVATNTTAVRTMAVWNDGNQPLLVTNVMVPNGYSVTQLVFTVPAGEAVPLAVRFSPADLIAYNGFLTLGCDASSGMVSAAVSGVGSVPTPSLGTRTITGLTAIITVDVPEGASILGIEDTLSPGLIPVSISDGGTWDAVNRKVKWFFNEAGQVRDRALQYRVSVPGSVVAGLVNFGSKDIPITGDTVFMSGGDPGLLHPADANGDWTVNLNEVSLSVSRWKAGQENVKTPIVIRGITLYRQGEQYAYDQQVSSEAKRWIPVISSSSLEQQAMKSKMTLVSKLSAGAVRDVQMTNVTITVTPETGTSAWGMEESVPAGVQVVNISEDGAWDVNNHKIKWAFFDGAARSLSYSINGDEGTKAAVLGTVSFDGEEAPVTGKSAVVVPLTFQTWASRQGLQGDMETLFKAYNPTYRQPNGLVYAFASSLQNDASILNIRWLNGEPVIEIPVQDPATVPYMDVVVEGTPDLIEPVWSIGLELDSDQTGVSADHCRLIPLVQPDCAFFRLQVIPK